jgi:uncharacterized membrane protein YbhN (UPF0104 family)
MQQVRRLTVPGPPVTREPGGRRRSGASADRSAPYYSGARRRRPWRRRPRPAGPSNAPVGRPLAAPPVLAPPLPGSATSTRRVRRRVLVGAALAVVAGAAVVSLSGAAKIGDRLATGRPAWIAVAAGFELLSVLGFATAFDLVFGDWLPRRMSLRMGVTVCAATILIPAGGLLAIGAGTRALRRNGMPAAKTRSRAIAFLLITNAPNAVVLGALGIALGVGLLDGPHAPSVTIVPAAIALSAIGLTLLLPSVSLQRMSRARLGIAHGVVSFVATELKLGVVEAVALLRGRSWKLLGAVAYYAFDNAVLWAAFKAFGHTDPPIATLVIAYLIGSAAASLPVPAGIGVVEGGMLGLLVLFGAPAICAGIAVLAYRAVSTGLTLALGGVAFLTIRRQAPRTPPFPAHQAQALNDNTFA